MPNTFYLDYENGADGNSGSGWDAAWKTITGGAAASRIAPGDVVRIAKSPSPSSLGSATWTNNSKTVTLSASQNFTIDNCEASWTVNGSGDLSSASRVTSTPSPKQGTYSVKFVLDSSPQTAMMQAYYAPAELNLSSHQKVSFWFYNSAAISASQWTLTLCSDVAGASPVDTFSIPAIPSTARWVPITLARDGGGNLGGSIKSVAVNTGSVAPVASSYIALDNIISCATYGLNLQSLISKNSAEQGGTEGWYGIQSIVTTTVLLDTETNTAANAGRGYSGADGAATTYFRETIKTDMAAASSTVVQEVQDSGTLAGGNIEFQGGYDTGTGNQTGETFFDGLNGRGYGIQLSGKSYITLNYLNVFRYNYGVYVLSLANNTTITTLSNANNNASYGVRLSSTNNTTITTLSNANNNGNYGVYIDTVSNSIITTLSNANNNGNYGVYFSSSNNNTVATFSNANNNGSHGIYFASSSINTITTLSTSNNGSGGIQGYSGWNYIGAATIAESTKAGGFTAYADGKLFIQSISGAANIWCDYGNIVSQSATAGGTGTEWKMSITNVARALDYPLKLKLAEVACAADAQVTVTCYFKKSHATDIAAKLVTPGNELAGVSQETATCPSDTSRNQLQIQFQPTAAGVVTIEAWAWWVANTADENVIIDDIAITQA